MSSPLWPARQRRFQEQLLQRLKQAQRLRRQAGVAAEVAVVAEVVGPQRLVPPAQQRLLAVLEAREVVADVEQEPRDLARPLAPAQLASIGSSGIFATLLLQYQARQPAVPEAVVAEALGASAEAGVISSSRAITP